MKPVCLLRFALHLKISNGKKAQSKTVSKKQIDNEHFESDEESLRYWRG